MSKRKRRLRQHTSRYGKNQPSPDGAAVLLPATGVCPHCGGNTFSHHPALRPPIYVLPDMIPPTTHHPRSFAPVHALIVEITLIVLLVLGCCTLVMPKVRMVLDEWNKMQSGVSSHASLAPTQNHEASSPSAPNPTPAVQPPTAAYNVIASKASERKEGKKPSIKRRRGKRGNLCGTIHKGFTPRHFRRLTTDLSSNVFLTE
jgi:hypothetical protein